MKPLDIVLSEVDSYQQNINRIQVVSGNSSNSIRVFIDHLKRTITDDSLSLTAHINSYNGDTLVSKALEKQDNHYKLVFLKSELDTLDEGVYNLFIVVRDFLQDTRQTILIILRVI